jgi:hypothetical protein
MRWDKKEIVEESSQFESRVGNVFLCIQDDSDQRWQYFSMVFGDFTGAGVEECQKTWAHRAISRAREELDKLEESLG